MAATSVWSALESSTSDALNQRLASALNTNDAQYWDETISPQEIKDLLATADPTKHSHSLQKCLKWLLANISKGRDVSEFYCLVIKHVACVDLALRKMVLLYILRYADYDKSTRELSLLSINAFQRGLADGDPWIRALALRVLTSMKVPDVYQIQLMAIENSLRDRSPYVRKCAANALAKLWNPDCIKMLQDLLWYEPVVMVLSSALCVLNECAPTRLDLLHTCFRKVCHLLTDMDEWGQVVTLDLLTRYVRTFFKKPATGRAELVDQARRVVRNEQGLVDLVVMRNKADGNVMLENTVAETSVEASTPSTLPPHPRTNMPRKMKRRVVKPAFYSDEEDESTEEEVYVQDDTVTSSISQTMRDTNVSTGNNTTANSTQDTADWLVGTNLSDDHALVLTSCLPLLKSRNAGVVLAVCRLHYECGVEAVAIRARLGRALVRIYRNTREIQFVVLQAIRTLCRACPSAFLPFLTDFFISALDLKASKLAKLDILVSLSLEPLAIRRVLTELAVTIRDVHVGREAIVAVGRVVEMARLVHDRHGAGGNPRQEREAANLVAFNVLFGLVTLTQASDSPPPVVSEAVCTIQGILQMLHHDAEEVPVDQEVPVKAVNRIFLLLVRTLNDLVKVPNAEDDEEEDDDQEPTSLEKVTVPLTPQATASALFVMCHQGQRNRVASLLPLVAQAFIRLEGSCKTQAISLARRYIDAPCAEDIMTLARLDASPYIRDWGRNGAAESRPPPASCTVPLEAPFRFGTLSSLVGHQVTGNLPLPPWSKTNSPDTLREPQERPLENQLYKEAESSEDSSNDDDESSSSEESDSDSETSSSSESGDDSGSDTSSSSTDAEPASASLDVLFSSPMASASPIVKDDPQSPSFSSSSSHSSAESSSDDESPQTGHDLLAGFTATSTAGALNASTTPSSYMNDFAGLTIAPPVATKSAPRADLENDSGTWQTLVRSEHASGLSVKARYIRGPSKPEKARSIGLSGDKATLVIMHVRFENVTSGSIRRLRVLQRASGGSAIGPKKVFLPPEVTELKTGQIVESTLAIDFANVSDREGSMLAKLEVKFGSGGIPVEIKPSLGDLLLPCEVSQQQFDQAVVRLQGFQRVDSKVTVRTRDELPNILRKSTAFSFLSEGWSSDNKLRLVGLLPSSSDLVYVLLLGPSIDVSLTVCSENALAVNSISSGLKRTIQAAS